MNSTYDYHAVLLKCGLWYINMWYSQNLSAETGLFSLVFFWKVLLLWKVISLVSIPGTLEADTLAYVPDKLTERACDNILGLTSKVDCGLLTRLVWESTENVRVNMRNKDYYNHIAWLFLSKATLTTTTTDA